MSMPTSKDISHIVKFDGSNFQQWKFGCRLLLESFNLLDIVDGVEKIPAADSNQKLIDAWKSKDVHARHYLFATIERQQQNTLYGCQSANDMWVRLTTQHAQNAAENKHLLMQQFFEYKYHPDHSVMSHISAIELLASQLKDLNEPVTEAQVMTKILVTLPPSFRHFLSVWDNVPAKNRNIQTLTQRLLKEENVAKIYNNGQSDAADSAFFSNNFPPQQSDRHSRGGFNNHRSRGGRPGRGAGTRHPYIRKCNYCGDTTHLYASCQERLRNERDKKGSPGEISNLAKDSNKNHGDHSYHSSTQQTIRNDSTWYADSGTTRHMTDQRNILWNFKPDDSTPRYVTGIGNTQLLTEGQGDVKATTMINGTEVPITIKNVLFVPKLGTNLFSIGATTNEGVEAVFTNNEAKFYRNGKLELTGQRTDNTLYQLNVTTKVAYEDSALATNTKREQSPEVERDQIIMEENSTLDQLRRSSRQPAYSEKLKNWRRDGVDYSRAPTNHVKHSASTTVAKRRVKSQSCVYLLTTVLYVHKKSVSTSILNYLNMHFEIRSLPADRFIGLDILRDRPNKKLFISQIDFVNKILKKFNLDLCHPKSIPADPNARLTAAMSPSTQPDPISPHLTRYREAIGCLMYIMTTTRPDIAFAVRQASQFCKLPGDGHWNGVKRIFAYLAGSAHLGLCFDGQQKNNLIGFTDSDLAGNMDNLRSTSCFVFLQWSLVCHGAENSINVSPSQQLNGPRFISLCDQIGVKPLPQTPTV